MTTMHPGYRDHLSLETALDADETVASLRARILAEYRAIPVELGITADQIARRLGIEADYIDVRKRVSELYQACFLERRGIGTSLFGKRQHAYVARKETDGR